MFVAVINPVACIVDGAADIDFANIAHIIKLNITVPAPFTRIMNGFISLYSLSIGK
jgi:hypothetical protein